MIPGRKIAVVVVSALGLAVAALIAWYATCYTKPGSGGSEDEGYYYVVQNADGKWGCIDRRGKVIVDFVYDEQSLGVFHDRYVIGWKNDVCYLSTTDGKPLAKATRGIWPLGGDLVALFDGDGCDIVSTDGTMRVGKFPACSIGAEGLIPVENRAGKWGFIDHDGKVRIDFQFDRTLGFSEGRAAVKYGGAFGYIDTTGSWVLKPQFAAALDYREGCAGVLTGGGWAYIDRAGKKLFQKTFKACKSFHGGLAVVMDDADNLGYIDKMGQHVIAPRFKWASDFSEGLAAVGFHEGSGRFRAGYIDRTGKPVIGFRQEPQELEPFVGGWAPVKFRGKSGLIDRKGNWVWINGKGPVTGYGCPVAWVWCLCGVALLAAAIPVWGVFLARRRRARHGGD